MNSWVSCLPRVSACPALRIATLSLLIKSDRFVARSQLLAPSLPPQCCKTLSIELVYELSAHSNKFKKEARSLCVCACVFVCPFHLCSASWCQMHMLRVQSYD